MRNNDLATLVYFCFSSSLLIKERWVGQMPDSSLNEKIEFISKSLEELGESILNSFPIEKRKAIARQAAVKRMDIVSKYYPKANGLNERLMSLEEIESLIGLETYECTLCEKSQEDAKKCRIRKELNKLDLDMFCGNLNDQQNERN